MGSVVYVVKRPQRFLASRRLMIFQVICEEATEKSSGVQSVPLSFAKP